MSEAVLEELLGRRETVILRLSQQIIKLDGSEDAGMPCKAAAVPNSNACGGGGPRPIGDPPPDEDEDEDDEDDDDEDDE